MSFDREARKFKKKMKEFTKDFEKVMGKGEEAGKKYGHKARKELHKLKDNMSEHFGHIFSKHDIPGKFKHAMEHVKMMSDVHDKGDKIIVNVELPGVEKRDVALKITTSHVEVKAHRREHLVMSSKTHHKEAVHERMFERMIPLPGHVEHEKAKAHFKNGLLVIEIPKKKIDKKLSLR